MKSTIENLEFVNKEEIYSIILISRMTSIELYNIQDVITKQFDVNSNFYYIWEGQVEMLKEYKDFAYFDLK